MPRLFYLGFAFPPGVQALFPGVNPAGHGFETRMIAALRQHFEIRSAGLCSVKLPDLAPDPRASPGVGHEILLSESQTTFLGRQQALATLKRRYQQWQAEGWVPEAILVYNLSPVYNAFIRWLRRQPNRPRLVLLLLDSSQLGARLPAIKRLRYHFKPMIVPDAAMLGQFDACIGLSTDVEVYFKPVQTPFLWMPGACDPKRTPESAAEKTEAAPVCFGYFGALAAYSGVWELAEVFRQGRLPATLRICGYGKLSDSLAQLARNDARIRFDGLLPNPDDCLAFGEGCDVLVNPRPPGFGNQNNFPSKLFDYALCGRAILSSRISGVDQVLGPEAFYYDVTRHPASLQEALEQIAGTDRQELRRRGTALRQRMVAEFNWANQAARMAGFVKQICAR